MRVAVSWSPRDPPLAVLGVVAFGAVADALQRRLLEAPPEVLGAWSGVAVPGGLAIRGAALPWVDGVRYVGAEPGASALWMPTTLRPSVPLALLQRAVVARCGAGSAPVILLRDRAIPLGGARPLDRELVAGWRR